MRHVNLCLVSICIGATSVVCMLRGLQVWAIGSGMNIGGMKSPQPLPVGPGKAVRALTRCSCPSELSWPDSDEGQCAAAGQESVWSFPRPGGSDCSKQFVPCFNARSHGVRLQNIIGRAACETHACNDQGSACRAAIAQPTKAQLKVEFGGTVIAESQSAVRTLETSHPPSYYFPQKGMLRKL